MDLCFLQKEKKPRKKSKRVDLEEDTDEEEKSLRKAREQVIQGCC